MKLIENETKFTHKSMPSWGVGIFLESDGTYITVDFENVGIKKIWYEQYWHHTYGYERKG